MGYHDLALLTASGALLMDLQTGRIDNRWHLFCLILGLVSRMIRDGPAVIPLALLSAFLPFLLLFWLHVFHMLGAGDIKLFCVLSTYLNPSLCIYFLLVSFLFGGSISLLILFRSRLLRERLCYLSVYIRQFMISGQITPYIRPGFDRQENIHFTIPIFCGILFLAGYGF